MKYMNIHDEKLLVAAGRGNIEGIKNALALGARVNDVNEKGETALMHATIYGKSDAVLFLLCNGADIDMKDKAGWAAVTYAVVSENEGLVRLFAERHADMTIKEFKKEFTLLMIAIDLESVGMVKLLMQELGMDVGSFNNEGIGEVNLAISTKNEEIIDLVISNGDLAVLKEIGRKVDEAMESYA